MDKELIKEIATQIVNESLLENWKFYLITIVLFLISYAIGNFLKSYMTQRGEQLARKSDLDKIIQELERTTKTTELIKNKIDKDSWIQKEINILRRQKLEELLFLLYDYQVNVHLETKESIIDNNDFSKDVNINRITALHKLYFPDLDDSMKEFYLSVASYGKWKVEALKQKTHSRKTENRPGPPCDDHLKLYSNVITNIVMAISAVEEQAKKVMKDLMSRN